MSEGARADWKPVAKLFSVFADETRLSLLRELIDGPRYVLQLVDALGTTQANISKQLQVLHRAKLLKREKRGTHVYYSILDGTALKLCEMALEMVRRTEQSADPED